MANFEKIYKRVASPVITLCIIGLLLTSTFPNNNTAFAVNGDMIVEDESLLHQAGTNSYNSLIQLDSDTYVLAYTDADNDGFITTFTISADGEIIEIATEEHNTGDGTYHSAVMVDSDTYLVAYASTLNMGKISTHTISAAGAITATNIIKLEHETTKAIYNSLVKVDSDTYALAYTGPADDGFIQTFTVPSDGSAITEVANEEHNESDATHNSLVHVDSTTYALAYASTRDMGKIDTFTISADGTTITEITSLEHEAVQATHNSLVKVDSDTYALAYTGANDNGFIQTFTISADGTTITEITSLEHETTKATHNSLVKVDSDTYALAYTGVDDDGYISTFTIPSDGSTITEVNTMEHDASDATYNSLVKVDSDTYALAYTGVDDDGYISTFTISGSSDSSGGRGNNCDYNGFGKNKSLKVNQVSYDIDTYQVQVQAYSTCGSISAKITTPTQQSILGLSTEQPLLGDMITIYSGFLDESDEKFNISIQNKRDSFDETFYIYDKSIIKKYTGTTGYTSQQQGTSLSTVTSEQLTVLPETTIVSELTVKITPEIIEEIKDIPTEPIIDEKSITPVEQTIAYTPEPTSSTCGLGTFEKNGVCVMDNDSIKTPQELVSGGLETNFVILVIVLAAVAILAIIILAKRRKKNKES